MNKNCFDTMMDFMVEVGCPSDRKKITVREALDIWYEDNRDDVSNGLEVLGLKPDSVDGENLLYVAVNHRLLSIMFRAYGFGKIYKKLLEDLPSYMGESWPVKFIRTDKRYMILKI